MKLMVKTRMRPFMVIYILVFFVLIVSAILFSGQLEYIPQITEVIPADFTSTEFVWKNTPVEIKGKHFKKQMDLYIDGMKLEQYTYNNEKSISFKMPEAFYEDGQKEIYLKNRAGLLSFISSNHYLLKMRSEDVIQPKITGYSVEKVSSITARIDFQGENFTDKTVVSLNAELQTNTILHSDKAMSVKINIPDWYKESSLIFVLTDRENDKIRSNIIKLINPFQINESHKKKSSLEYLKNGYLVSHAFGELDGKSYTNSLEAFMHSYKTGHRVFEVDLQFTKDDILATIHDKPEINTFAEEQKSVPYTILTFEQLCKLMVEYNDVYIITDSKYSGNLAAVKNAADVMIKTINQVEPKLIDRFVIQFYTQKMYHFLSQNYPFVSYIYTLYQSPDTDEEVIQFVKATGIPVVTMWGDRAVPGFIKQLNEAGAYTFVHTVNDSSKVNDFMQRGVYGAYTDRLTYTDFSIPRTERHRTMNHEDINARLRAESLKSYINELNQTNVLQILINRGQALASLPADIVHSFPGNPGGNEPYQFFIKQGGKILYQASSADQLSQKLKQSFGMDLSITTDDSGITVGDISYPLAGTGLVFLKLNLQSRILEEMVQFDVGDSCRMIPLDASRVNNRNALMEYLDQINKDKYLLMFSVADEGSNALDDKLQKKLAEMGLKQKLKGNFRWSYLAIINNGKVLAEELSPKLIEKSVLIDDWLVSIKSGGFEAGSISSVQVDGVEYSQNRRGLNIVVFDKTIGSVVDSVCFDTHLNFGKYPQ